MLTIKKIAHKLFLIYTLSLLSMDLKFYFL